MISSFEQIQALTIYFKGSYHIYDIYIFGTEPFCRYIIRTEFVVTRETVFLPSTLCQRAVFFRICVLSWKALVKNQKYNLIDRFLITASKRQITGLIYNIILLLIFLKFLIHGFSFEVKSLSRRLNLIFLAIGSRKSDKNSDILIYIVLLNHNINEKEIFDLQWPLGETLSNDNYELSKVGS